MKKIMTERCHTIGYLMLLSINESEGTDLGRAPQNQLFTSPNKKTTKKGPQNPHLLGTFKFIGFSILSALLTQSAFQLIFIKCLSLLHLNQFKNCTCFMRPMCASVS